MEINELMNSCTICEWWKAQNTHGARGWEVQAAAMFAAFTRDLREVCEMTKSFVK